MDKKFLERLHNSDLAILFLRIAIGIVFISAGWMKISGIEGVIGFFGAFGIAPAFAYIVAYSEFIGGILILLGLLTRYAGIVLAIVMLVAIFKVHIANGFSLANNGYEYTLVLLLSSLALVFQGAGKYALGKVLKKN